MEYSMSVEHKQTFGRRIVVVGPSHVGMPPVMVFARARRPDGIELWRL
jgi:hypothetical protein